MFSLKILGYANCDVNCNSNSCRRSFVISKVPQTNLYFVFVDGLCPSSSQSYPDGVPGVHQEDILYILTIKNFELFFPIFFMHALIVLVNCFEFIVSLTMLNDKK